MESYESLANMNDYRTTDSNKEKKYIFFLRKYDLNSQYIYTKEMVKVDVHNKIGCYNYKQNRIHEQKRINKVTSYKENV